MPQTVLAELLGLSSRPIAITFVDRPPAGVPRVPASEPAGCGYWRRASDGEVFYTVADDHKQCPVGAHTHNVTLSPAESGALLNLIETMAGLKYLRMEEVSRIPTRKTPFAVAIYAPLEASPLAPDVVLVRGNARQLMLLSEAAQAADTAATTPAMGRPTCAVLPEAINSARTAASFGCIGNRVYTAASDDEAYFAIPGARLPDIEEQLAVIVRANQELENYHRARRAGTASA